MLRAGMLPINANLHRFKTDITLQYCPFCANCFEEEIHFMFVCPLYAALRTELFRLTPSRYHHVNLDRLMKSRGTHALVVVTLYIRKALTVREKFVETL